jgi:hypothetical protein
MRLQKVSPGSCPTFSREMWMLHDFNFEIAQKWVKIIQNLDFFFEIYQKKEGKNPVRSINQHIL